MEDDVAGRRRQAPPGRAQREAHRLGERRHHLHAPRLRALGPGGDAAGVDRALRIGNDLVRVDAHQGAEAGAGRAGAVGAVEGEQARRDLGQARAALGAGIVLRQRLLGGALRRQHHQAAGDLEGGLDRLGEALLDAGLDHQAVDDDVDAVLLLLVEGRQLAGQLGQLQSHAVDAGAQEAFAGHLRQLLAVLALLAADVGRIEHQPAAKGQLHGAVHHLLHGLRADALAAGGAVRHADAGVEQTQVVVDLGDRADGRARVARHRLLLDRDGRREPLDGVHVRLLHLLEELPRVRRQRLDVAPLPLREQRVEGERRLAGPRDPGDDHQPVPGDLQVDVLEVVLARAADRDRIHWNPRLYHPETGLALREGRSRQRLSCPVR